MNELNQTRADNCEEEVGLLGETVTKKRHQKSIHQSINAGKAGYPLHTRAMKVYTLEQCFVNVLGRCVQLNGFWAKSILKKSNF